MNEVSNPIETYRNVGIAMEQNRDCNYYCILGGNIFRSQLIDQLYSEIDKYLDADNRKIKADCAIEYMVKRSDLTYITIRPVEISENRDELFSNASKALDLSGINHTRIIAVSRN